MANANACWGIEVGAGSVKALKLERNGDNVTVVDFALIPHKRVLSTPDLDVQDATRLAIGELVATRDLSNAKIAISVPGHSAFARFAKLPPVEPKKIPDIVKFEAVQQVPFPIDEVEWDYQTFQSPDQPDVEVGIFAITRERVMERLAMWADVGVTPDIVTLSPLAAYNAVAFDLGFTADTPGTVLLDVGTTSTDLIVAEAGRVWIRTFPIGGHNFTEKLVEAFKLSYTKAEALKRQAEQSTHARHVFQAMRPVFSDLAQDVQRSIGYYQSLHREANLTRLIGVGSTFALPGLRKYLSQQLQMEVMRLEQFQRLNLDGPMGGEFQAATMNLATVYGLCLQGLGFDHGIMANLMPVSVTREAMWKKKVKWFGVAAGLALAAGGVTFVKYFTDSASINSASQPEIIQSTTRKLDSLKKEWSAVEADMKADQKVAVMLSLTDSRQVLPRLVDDVAEMSQVALSSAGDKSTQDGAFVFEELKTNYEGMSTPEFDPAGGMPPPLPPEPVGGVGEGDPNNVPPEGAAPAAPAGPRRKIRLELTFTSNLAQSDAQGLEKACQKWLRDNATRKDIGYEISKTSITSMLTPIGAEGGRAPAAGNQGGPGGGAAPAGGGGRRQRDNQRQPQAQNQAQNQGEIDRLAPLPAAQAPAAGPGLYTVRVSWEVLVDAPVAAAPPQV